LKRTLENGAKNERALVVAQKVCFWLIVVHSFMYA
jgi:hypothetical protein